ncbi:MAG: ATP-binding cassette domain-containing protein [Eubacteriales bacterium]|nr:ATP-binding cassette domain-containing protein [Eubacteriales bacterium]
MKIRNLTKSYEGHKVLDQCSLTLEEGKVYALMGPSGCGKTTLLHILMGIVEKDEGSIEGIAGKEVSAVFQENRLFTFLSAGENAAAVQKKAQKLEDINEILAEILPRESLNQMVQEYSGGMKRRAAIGRAMLAESDFIIMDEPFTGLDEETKNQVIQFIKKYRRGRTLIFSTHQEREAELLHGEKIVLNQECDV